MKNLSKLRISRGLSQKALEEIFKYSQQTISGYETGNSEPNIETMIKFADFFHTTIDYLVGRTEVPYPYLEAEKYAINEEEASLIRAFRRIRKEDRDALTQIAKALMQQKD